MKNILFVDDDQELLNGFKRALRRKKDEWKIYFSLDPNKALTLMEQIKVDVVVSDMKMPSMYGATFLTIVNRKFPDTIRFILSGQADDDTIFKSLKPSHQFISKPCSAEDIILKIESVLRSSTFLTNTDVKEKINNLTTLPVMPHLYLELEKELKKDDYSIQSIAEIISSDIGMSTQILKIVNSSYFGLKKEVSDIKQAVSFVGIDYIKNITLVTKVFESSKSQSAFAKGLYENGLKHAAINKQFAELLELEKNVASNLYLISMLQNVGFLILEKIYPEILTEVGDFNEGNFPELLEKEEELFKDNHFKIGAYLLCLWGMKSPIVESIAYWNSPTDCSEENSRYLAFMHYSNNKLYQKDIDEAYCKSHLGKDITELDELYESASSEEATNG